MKAKARAVGKEPDPETNVLEVHAVSMDGSWNKRGRTSNFGHVTAFDCDTGLALATGHRSKVCGICYRAKNKGREVEPGHKCRKNWENSSGSMEPDIVVEIVNKLYREKGIKIAHYVGDNDTAVMNAIKNEVDPKIGGDMVKMTDPNHQFGNFRDRLDTKVRPFFKKALTARNMDHLKKLYEKNVYAFPGQPERMRECMLNMMNHLFDLDHSACNTFNHIKCAKESDPSHMTSNLSYGKYLDPNLKAMVPIPKKKASKASGKKEQQVPAYKEVTFLEAVREVIEEFSELEVLKRLANPDLSSQINEALHSVHVRNSSPKFMPYEKTVEPRYEAAVVHFSWGVFKTHLEFRRFLGLGKKRAGRQCMDMHFFFACWQCLISA